MTMEPLLRQGRIGYCSCGEIAVDWEEASTSSQESASSSSSESSSVSTESSSSLPSGDVVRVEAAISPYRNGGLVEAAMASDLAYLANTFDAFAITVNAVFANGESAPIKGEGAVTFDRNGYCHPYYNGALGGYIATFGKQGSFEMKISADVCVHEDDGNGQAKDVVKRFETSLSVTVDDSDPAWDALKKTARELYPWVNGLNEGSVERIRYETGYIGVAPGSLRDIYYLESPQAISDALRITSATFAECSPLVSQMAGGWYYEYSYLIGGEKNTVRVNNGYVSIGGKSYKAQAYGAPSIWPDDEHRLGFVTLFSTSEANPVEGGEPIGFDGLGEIEFWAWPDDMGYVAEDALWRIDDFGEPLYVYEAKRFSYRGEMFQVLGDADFGALFA